MTKSKQHSFDKKNHSNSKQHKPNLVTEGNSQLKEKKSYISSLHTNESNNLITNISIE